MDLSKLDPAVAEAIGELRASFGRLVGEMSKAKEEISPEAVANAIDMDTLAGHCDVDISAYDVATEIDTSDVASHISEDDVAYHISHRDVASYINIGSLAQEISIPDLANELSWQASRNASIRSKWRGVLKSIVEELMADKVDSLAEHAVSMALANKSADVEAAEV